MLNFTSTVSRIYLLVATSIAYHHSYTITIGDIHEHTGLSRSVSIAVILLFYIKSFVS